MKTLIGSLVRQRDRPTKGQGHLLSCCGHSVSTRQLKSDGIFNLRFHNDSFSDLSTYAGCDPFLYWLGLYWRGRTDVRTYIRLGGCGYIALMTSHLLLICHSEKSERAARPISEVGVVGQCAHIYSALRVWQRPFLRLPIIVRGVWRVHYALFRRHPPLLDVTFTFTAKNL